MDEAKNTMTKEQKEIVLQTVSGVVQEALSRTRPPSGREVKELAVDAARAMSAAFAELN